jgi:hypothetical protein
MLRRVALVRTYVSEERSASIIRVTRIGELGTTLAVTSNQRTLRRSTKLVRKRSIPTDRPFVGEVSSNFWGQRGVAWSAQWISAAGYLGGGRGVLCGQRSGSPQPDI